MDARRGLGVAVLCCLLGAIGVLISVGQRWATVALSHGEGVPTTGFAATGASTVGALSGLGLVGLAGVAGIFAARGWARRIVGSVVALAGVGSMLLAVLGRSAARLTESALASAPGAVVTAIESTAWPWVAATGGVLMAAGGLLVAAYGGRWSAMSRRYDAPSAARDPDSDAWAALDRGEDPTEDPSRPDPSATA